MHFPAEAVSDQCLLMVNRALQLSRADHIAGIRLAVIHGYDNETVMRILDRSFEVASLVINSGRIARVKHQRNRVWVCEQWQLYDKHSITADVGSLR